MAGTGCAATSSPPCWSTRRSTGAASRSSSGWSRRRPPRRRTCSGRTWWSARCSGCATLWDAVEALDNKVPPELQTAVYLDTRRLLDRAVRWLVTNRRSPIDVPAEIARLRDGVTRLLPGLETLFYGSEREAIAAHIDSLTARGLPRDLAEQATRLMYSFGLLDVVETARGDRPGRGRGGLGLLRALRPVPGGRAAVEDLPAAAGGPLADVGPDGAALRPVRRAGRAHRRGARAPPRKTCRRPSGCRSGSRRTPPRSTGRTGRWGSSTSPGPTCPPCRCCCVRSVPWCGPRRAA